ncbi:22551_t:CDS:1 [Cetraspora pellucida]|uniref:22551_t:CDS:1 n=1 Tax=Cetraspora pellucida TaxID=1433469 RepID=A0A9N9BXJ7_9GLOM|nr:22551_t:CDS:1 [Cetraspora pellucida]
MANNNGPVPSNSPSNSNWFSYVYSVHVNIIADDQGFSYRYSTENVDNELKTAIDQKKSHCRLQKVVFTFVPNGNRDDDYYTLTYHGSVADLPRDKNRLKVHKKCYETRKGGISQRTVRVESEFRKSESTCNLERAYILFSSSDTSEVGMVGILKIDYHFEYFNRIRVS